jgi:ribose transport system permease protein
VIKKLRLDKFSALYLWLLFVVVFGFLRTDTYLSWTTLHLQLREYTLPGIMALAFLVPLATGTFDLSIGFMAGLSLVGSAVLIEKHHWSPITATCTMMVVCAILGAISGWFVVKMRISSFIATLGMGQVANALTLKLGGNRTITSAFSPSFQDIGVKKWFGQERYVYAFFALAIIIWFVFEHTPVGRYMFATGGNPEAARLAGIKTDRLIWRSLVVSAVIAGFVGIVQSWKVGIATATFGPPLLFPAIAAVFFGASQLKGRPNVWGTVIALFCLAWGIKGLQLLFTGSTTWLEPFFQGVSLLIAVSLAARTGIIKVRRPKTQREQQIQTAQAEPVQQPQPAGQFEHDQWSDQMPEQDRIPR